ARVPASVPFGVQPLAAVDSQGRRAAAGVEVRWGGWPPAVATVLGQSGPAEGEVTFTLNIRNRSDYILEHVRVVLKDPGGAVLVRADPAPQQRDATLEWEVPVLDRG